MMIKENIRTINWALDLHRGAVGLREDACREKKEMIGYVTGLTT